MSIEATVITLWNTLPKKERRYAFQLSIVFFAQIVDVITTAIALQVGASEGNPLMRKVIQQGGIELFSIVKIFAVIGLIALMEVMRRIFSEKKLSEWYLDLTSKTNTISNIFMAIVLINNISTIQQQL